MATKELKAAETRYKNLMGKLKEAETLVMELKASSSKKEAEAITRAILSIQDDNVLIQLHALIDQHVASPKDRKTLGLEKRGDKNEKSDV